MARRLMCVLAHPDDESLGMGGTLAKYAAEGVETYLVTATRGERGRFVEGAARPSDEVVGQTREAELRAAARELGVREVTCLGYPDGGVDCVSAETAQAAIAEQLRRIKPHVVLTFGPDGAYGHPDHIAISQLTTAAIVRASDQDYAVAKLYYLAWGASTWAAYQAALKKLTSVVDGVERNVIPIPDWHITTRIDTGAVWPVVWRAVQCHRTQMSIYANLATLPPEHHRALWGVQEFARVFSLVNGGRTRESDLFEGLP
ncbi:MAG TPA: PIG-L deacetylase family protein [Vicinamibacterales bacterium]